VQDVKVADEKLGHVTDEFGTLPPVRSTAVNMDIKKVCNILLVNSYIQTSYVKVVSTECYDVIACILQLVFNKLSYLQLYNSH